MELIENPGEILWKIEFGIQNPKNRDWGSYNPISKNFCGAPRRRFPYETQAFRMRNGQKNVTKRERFACEMAQIPYETQAFRMQCGQKTLRTASVSHSNLLKTFLIPMSETDFDIGISFFAIVISFCDIGKGFSHIRISSPRRNPNVEILISAKK